MSATPSVAGGEEGGGEEDACAWYGHLDMLHDTERNMAYAQAIELASAALRRRELPRTAVDVGAGSGLLSCLATRAGMRVAAFECVPALAHVSRAVTAANGLGVDVISAHSTLAARNGSGGWSVAGEADVHERASLLVHELLDTPLLGEGLLTGIRHARDVLHRPDGISIPRSVVLWAVPVHSVHLGRAACVPESLMPMPPSVRECAECAPSYLELRTHALADLGDLTPLAEPTAVLRIDCHHPTSPGEHACCAERLRPVQGGAGLAPTALVTWWEAEMWRPESGGDGERVVISTDPWRRPAAEREHWLSGVHLLPEGGAPIGAADVLAAAHDDDDVWMAIQRAGAPTCAPPARRLCRCGLHALWGPQRFLQLHEWAAHDLASTVAAAAAAHGPPGRAARCVDLADGPLLSVAAARAACEVVCVESDAMAAVIASRVASAAGLSQRIMPVACAQIGGDEGDESIADPPLPAELSGPVDLLLLEPHFTVLRGSWAGPHLAELVRRRRWAEGVGVVRRSTPMLPHAARCFAVLLECPLLSARHRPVSHVEGFDFRAFNALAGGAAPFGASPLALPLWQFAHRPLSEPFEWARTALPADADANRLHGRAAPAVLDGGGTCHALAVWVDFDLGAACMRTGARPVDGTGDGAPLSAPTAWPQAILLLPDPLALPSAGRTLTGSDAGALQLELELDLESGDVRLLHGPSGAVRATVC